MTFGSSVTLSARTTHGWATLQAHPDLNQQHQISSMSDELAADQLVRVALERALEAFREIKNLRGIDD